MRKLLHRPAMALAATLSVIFLIILIKTYFRLPEFRVPVLIEKNDERESVDNVQSRQSVVFEGPQLPSSLDISTKVLNTKITFGTFEAMIGNCFLRENVTYESYYNYFDEFKDLVDVIKNLENKTSKDDEKCDTLGELLTINYDSSEENNHHLKFYSEISRYRMYSENSEVVENLLYGMKTQGIRTVDEVAGAKQFKLMVKFDNNISAIFKPRRISREQQELPTQLYFAEFERHSAEIAAYHLDKILGFRRALPVVGRKLNLISDVMRLVKPNLQRSFFVSPKPDENICFTGNCEQFCDSYHPICGNGTFIEGSFMVNFPEVTGADRMARRHPWGQSHSNDVKAPYETDPNYCDKVIELEMYAQGRLLLELIDMSIFDFMIGNMDRHTFERFTVFGEDTFTIRYDHGHAFGKAFHDEFKILAPLLQCCLIRSTTLETLLSIHNSKIPLSQRMRNSLADDLLSPILSEPHLKALDRRLIIVLQAVRGCRYSPKEVIIPTDNVDFE